MRSYTKPPKFSPSTVLGENQNVGLTDITTKTVSFESLLQKSGRPYIYKVIIFINLQTSWIVLPKSSSV